ncbi:GNAT family N-acetyltransferase [Neobacillus sp. GCM10023253]|uniref:GNAT family N-acetyltransferase n=1 Tax=unclassified Neobacillus TaxID=2675272 RepID=UPI003618DEF9
MRLEGKEIYLRFLEEKDAKAMTQLTIKNREFFQETSPKRSEHFYSFEHQLRSIRFVIQCRELETQYSFGIFLKKTNELIGDIELFDIVKDSFQSCYVGYSLDRQYNGKGYMTEAVKLVVNYAFKELGLHRIAAGVMPSNIGSIRVLEKAGFEKEGIARKNIKINGNWEDHLQMSILNEIE